MKAWAPESPFLETTYSAETDEAAPAATPVVPSPWLPGESPFVRDRFETAGLRGAESDAVSELLETLRDEAFDRSVYQLAAKANEHLGGRYDGEAGEATSQSEEAERKLQGYFAPVVAEGQAMFERMAEGLERQDVAGMSEVDLESLLDRYAPSAENLDPEMQFFLGNLWKKAAGFARGAVDFARKGISAVAKAGLAPLLRQIGRLVQPLVQRIIRFALNRLPAGVRPIAQKLAQRLLGSVVTAKEEEAPVPASSTRPVEVVQHEFDLQLADLLLGDSTEEREESVHRFAERPEEGESDPAAALHAAKAQFVREFARLQERQDPTPLVQDFLPAALLALQPVVKTAIGIIGRPRVVAFLGDLIARFIQQWVGAGPAKTLSASLADVGLGLLGFETPSRDPRADAAEFVGEALEQTVVGIAQIPEHALDNEVMLEAYAREAFEQAASALFPDGVIRPELRETARETGAWISMPRDRKRKYYKKYSRAIDVEITPRVASQVKVFGGTTLADFFNDVLLLPAGRTVKAKAHLYEVVVGSRLSDIAVREKGVPGLGNSGWEAWSQIHPLTPEAATALFKEPGLGKEVDQRYLAGPYLVGIGQRFYYLQIPGMVKPVPKPPPGKEDRPSRKVPVDQPRCSNRVGVIADLGGARIVVKLRFSEQAAQEIAQALRRKDVAGAWRIMKTLDGALRETVRNRKVGFTLKGFELEAYLGDGAGEYQVAAAGGGIMAALGEKLLEKILDKLVDLLWEGLANYVKNTAQEFVRAADDRADGITVFVAFVNIPGLAQIRNVRQGGILAGILPSLDLNIPRPSISVQAGCAA